MSKSKPTRWRDQTVEDKVLSLIVSGVGAGFTAVLFAWAYRIATHF